MASFKAERGMFANLRTFLYGEAFGERVGGFLSRRYDVGKAGQAAHHRLKVSRLHYHEVLVRRRVLQSADGCGGVVHADALTGKKAFDVVKEECLVLLADEAHLVLEEADAEDAPHVVGEVGIIEVHRPAFLSRREAAEHQQTASFWKERRERMALHWRKSLCGAILKFVF